jgi:hypothetical protein
VIDPQAAADRRPGQVLDDNGLDKANRDGAEVLVGGRQAPQRGEGEGEGEGAVRVGRGVTRVSVSHVDSAARSAAATVREASAGDAAAVVLFFRVFADNLGPGRPPAAVDTRAQPRGLRTPRSPR